MNLREGLEAINKEVASRLWALADEKRVKPRLVIPMTRKTKTKKESSPRVSEQEARVLLCQVLDGSQWFYSVETPTREVFKEKGFTPLSARTDVSLYEGPLPSDQSKKVNIELKANNPPVEEFRKDFEKLVREGLNGVWFHLLRNSDEGTLRSVFKKIHESFQALEKWKSECKPPPFILFAFCELDLPQGRHQRLRQGVLEIGDQTLQQILGRVEHLFGPKAQPDLEAAGWRSFKPMAPLGKQVPKGSPLAG